MSTPKKDKHLLTDTERERLANKNLDSDTRKRTTLIARRKLQAWFNQIDDVLFALEHLDDTQLERTIPDSDIFTLFKATDLLLRKLGFSPVKGDPENPCVTGMHIPVDGSTAKVFARRAKESDFERNWQVEEFVRSLKCYYESEPAKMSPAYGRYYEERTFDEIEHAAHKFGLKMPDRTPGTFYPGLREEDRPEDKA